MAVGQELEGVAAEAGAQFREGDEEGGEGDDDGEPQHRALLDEELLHIVWLMFYAVTCR